SSALARHLARRARESVRKRGRFDWVVSGGATPEPLYALLADRYRTTFPWARTQIWFGDERCVPPDDPDSNYGRIRTSLLAKVSVPDDQVHRIRGELGPARTAAALYTRALRSALMFPD